MMDCRRTTSARTQRWLAVACLASALLPAPAWVATTDAPADRAALEKQLAEARGRLDAAASDVARLSSELYGDQATDIVKHVFLGPPGAMLGINIARSASRDEGVEVAAVSPGGPAERAGLKAGDVVVAVDGQALRKSGDRSPGSQLVAHMRSVEPGQAVRVEYLRDGKRLSASITAAPAEPPMARVMRDRMAGGPLPGGMEFPRFHEFMLPSRAFDGMELVPMTSGLGRYFGTDQGLLVVRAPREPGLPLEDGDVLLTIGGRTPEGPGQAYRILQSYEPGEKVRLGVLRNRKRLELEATLPARGAVEGPPPVPHPPRPPGLSPAPRPAPPPAPSSTT